MVSKRTSIAKQNLAKKMPTVLKLKAEFKYRERINLPFFLVKPWHVPQQLE